MKVLHVNKFFYPRGGAETAYFATAELLERHGHQVIPFSMQDPRNLPSDYSGYFVSNLELRPPSAHVGRAISAATRILYSREAEQKIDALISETKPDIAHLHNVYHQLSPSILRALRRHGIPAVMTLHDYKLICPAYTLHDGMAVCERCKEHNYYNAVARRCVKGSRLKSLVCASEAYLHDALGSYRDGIDAYIAPSRFMAAKVVEFGLARPSSVAFIPNFIMALPTHRMDSGDYFMYAGRLERVKGVGTLLRAVAHTPKARNCELRIAGDGEERAALESTCRQLGLENVRFVGQLGAANLVRMLAGARFIVVPSEWYENAPLSVLEAAAHGKTIIASDIGGLPEMVIHGETGLLFRAGNALQLGQAINELLLRPARAREMGRRARQFVAETFSAERHYRELMTIYRRALTQPRDKSAIGGQR